MLCPDAVRRLPGALRQGEDSLSDSLRYVKEKYGPGHGRFTLTPARERWYAGGLRSAHALRATLATLEYARSVEIESRLTRQHFVYLRRTRTIAASHTRNLDFYLTVIALESYRPGQYRNHRSAPRTFYLLGYHFP